MERNHKWSVVWRIPFMSDDFSFPPQPGGWLDTAQRIKGAPDMPDQTACPWRTVVTSSDGDTGSAWATAGSVLQKKEDRCGELSQGAQVSQRMKAGRKYLWKGQKSLFQAKHWSQFYRYLRFLSRELNKMVRLIRGQGLVKYFPWINTFNSSTNLGRLVLLYPLLKERQLGQHCC